MYAALVHWDGRSSAEVRTLAAEGPTTRSASTSNLSAEQLRQLALESGRYGSLVLLLGTVGLRWGEAAALRVPDVNFLRRRIVLHENAVAVGGRTHVGTLKSGLAAQ